MKITSSNIIRWAGFAAMGAGILYIAIQAIHPLDVFSSVTTAQWAITHDLSIVMDILAMLGIAAIYARQVEQAGWLGLAGYLLFSLFWALSLAFHFIEAFIEPVVANVAPQFVAGLLGMVTSAPSEINLGALPTVYMLAGIGGYVLGGLLFGIATFRAGILPRWAGGLLALGAILPPLLSSLVHHPFDRLFAVPVGLALIWLGYALWSERRAPAAEPVPGQGNPQLSPTAVA
ncbi:MAG TPA: hypothetical protein P5526_30030 [Anaerolineae bacterium]|nr:hypothetical protein [Anaerolineae bacterium]